MEVVGLQYSKIREYKWKDKIVRSSILKDQYVEEIEIGPLGGVMDTQADKLHHGGPFKAVYTYDIAHHDYWRELDSSINLFNGCFGENITTKGLKEESVEVGDQFSFGEVVLQATIPRIPCSKLNMQFQDDRFIKKFIQSHCYGLYFSVVRPGVIHFGDEIQLLKKSSTDLRMVDFFKYVIKLKKISNKDELLLKLKQSLTPEHYVEVCRYFKMDVSHVKE